MNIRRLALAVSVGIGAAASLTLLCARSGLDPVTAAEVVSFAPPLADGVTAEGATANHPLDESPIHYVATTGSDSGDCSTPTGACRTVQFAVDRAGEGDEIRVASGVYTGVHAHRAPSGYTGSGIITQVVYIDKSLTVRGGYTTSNWSVSDPLSYPTTVDAQEQGRVLFIVGQIEPTIEGLRIAGGDATGLGGEIAYGAARDAGGGVYILFAAANIIANQVFENTATTGGGLYLWNSAASVHGNTFFANSALQRGGGMCLQSYQPDPPFIVSAVSGNTIVSNTAQTSGGGVALWNCHATVSGNVISSNTAGKFGGGLYQKYPDAAIYGNTIFSNTASSGGGVYLEESFTALSRNTVIGNAAHQDGGGLHMDSSIATLTNDVVADNQAGAAGSGLYIGGAISRLNHTSIVHNSGGEGIGVTVTDNASSDRRGTLDMVNTILVSHTVGLHVTSGNTATLEATLWGTGAWANLVDWSGDGLIITGTVNIWGDPRFVGLQVGDYHILPASAAIAAGVDGGVRSDIDYEPRPILAPDIGADEHWLPGVLRLIYLPLALPSN